MKRYGFSLIEVVFAIAGLTIILGGMLGIFGEGYLSLKRSRERGIAYNLARAKLEDKTATSPWPPASEVRAVVSGFTNFERQVSVTNPYLGNSNLARIEVTMWWDSGNKSQYFVTLKANY